MRPAVLLLSAAVMLAGCATRDDAKPPICDGRHLRPANPYGSVLAPQPPAPSADAGPRPSAPARPAEPAKPPSASQAFGSCGA